MSSKFVSGGTIDNPIERGDEWLRAQQEIEASRRRKEEESREQGGKTLYEVLQNNKAAKQEAFEESIRLKNQFRNLDEDEVEFLDSVLESTRAKEQAVKKETSEQLEFFRRQQEEADKEQLRNSGDISEIVSNVNNGTSSSENTSWALNSRKRKRAKDKEVLKGVKLRRSSSASETSKSLAKSTSLTTPHLKTNDGTEQRSQGAQHIGNIQNTLGNEPERTAVHEARATSPSLQPIPTSQTSTKHGSFAGLGLAAYSSDEEE